MKKLCCLCVFLAFLLPGKVHAAAEDHIVTRVRVAYQDEDARLSRQYTHSENMEAVLNFLRLSKFAGLPADDPEAHTGSRCTVTVELAGGSHRVYYLHDERYLSKDGAPWELVEPPASMRSLLESLPGDR